MDLFWCFYVKRNAFLKHFFRIFLTQRQGFTSKMILSYRFWWNTYCFFSSSFLFCVFLKTNDKDLHQKCYLCIDFDEARDGFCFLSFCFINCLKTRQGISSTVLLSYRFRWITQWFLYSFIFCIMQQRYAIQKCNTGMQ